MPNFLMNGYRWHVVFVDPSSSRLVDRTGLKRVATTDPGTRCVYLSRVLNGDFLRTVLVHELGHVTMFSYGLLDILHTYVYPEYWIEAEEWVCNFLADYGEIIRKIAEQLLRDMSSSLQIA